MNLLRIEKERKEKIITTSIQNLIKIRKQRQIKTRIDPITNTLIEQFKSFTKNQQQFQVQTKFEVSKAETSYLEIQNKIRTIVNQNELPELIQKRNQERNNFIIIIEKFLKEINTLTSPKEELQKTSISIKKNIDLLQVKRKTNEIRTGSVLELLNFAIETFEKWNKQVSIQQQNAIDQTESTSKEIANLLNNITSLLLNPNNVNDSQEFQQMNQKFQNLQNAVDDEFNCQIKLPLLSLEPIMDAAQALLYQIEFDLIQIEQTEQMNQQYLIKLEDLKLWKEKQPDLESFKKIKEKMKQQNRIIRKLKDQIEELKEDNAPKEDINAVEENMNLEKKKLCVLIHNQEKIIGDLMMVSHNHFPELSIYYPGKSN